MDCPNIIFLDSDTIIKRDLSELLEGEYEFSGRIAPGFLDIDIDAWNQMFLERGKIPVPMINTGFMIFKNHTHNRIADEDLYYMNSDLPHPHPVRYYKDQYAISLAVSGRKIKCMDKTIHAFLWNNEVDGYVIHGSKLAITSDLSCIKKKMNLWLENYVPSLLH